MKKVLILLTAFVLVVTACNNDKKSDRDRDRTSRDRDDYRDRDDKDADRDRGNSDDRDTRDTRSDDRPTRSGDSWSSTDVNAFVSNCVSTAVEGGMQQRVAQNYCECMQVKLEKLYPNSSDAGRLTSDDMNSESMQRMVKDCLTGY